MSSAVRMTLTKNQNLICSIVNFEAKSLSFSWTSEKTSKDFLLEHPRGAYTTMRTLGSNSSILQWQMQVERLQISFKKLFPSSKQQAVREEDLRQFVGSCLEQWNKKHNSNDTVTNASVRLTLLLLQESDISLTAHCYLNELLPKKITSTITVQVAPIKGRDQANVKDSQWVRDRQSLESKYFSSTSSGAVVEEVILQDAKSLDLYEGLSSNFFLLYQPEPPTNQQQQIKQQQQLCLVTAPKEHVLVGTIMQIVLDAAEEIQASQSTPDFNFSLKYEFPNPVKHAPLSGWKAAFITSTSRLLLPVGKINFEDSTTSNSTQCLELDQCFLEENPIAKLLISKVNEKLSESSTRLIS